MTAPGSQTVVLCRADRLLFAELKSERGRLSAAQREWREALGMAGVRVRVWRPSDWDEIVEVLR